MMLMVSMEAFQAFRLGSSPSKRTKMILKIKGMMPKLSKRITSITCSVGVYPEREEREIIFPPPEGYEFKIIPQQNV